MRITSNCKICGGSCYRKYDGDWTHYNDKWNQSHRAMPVDNPPIKFQVTISFAEYQMIERMRNKKMKYAKLKLYCKICGALAGYSDSEGVSIVGCKNCDFGRREGLD